MRATLACLAALLALSSHVVSLFTCSSGRVGQLSSQSAP
jgi:hypothetical protein